MRSARAISFGVLAAVMLAATAPGDALGQTTLFSDAFDSETITQFTAGPVGSTGWTFSFDEPNQNDVRYGFDYSSITASDGSVTVVIPEAPNTQPGDAPQTGVALRTNVSAGAIDQAALSYDDASFTGQYRVQVDMYLSWAADAEQIGTTEFGGLFIGTDLPSNPVNPVSADHPESRGAGALFTSDGDSVNFDHVLLKNNIYPSIQSGQYTVTDFGFGTQLGYDNTDVNTDPANGDLIDLPALFPSFTLPNGITQPAGSVGNRWITLTADVDTDALGMGTGTVPGTTTFSVTIADSGESYTLGTIDNSVIDDINDGPLNGFDTATEQGPVDMSGRVTLTLIDFFTSVASDINLATAIFDNLLVTQVEAGLPGDYNDDGFVDAADYVAYRNTLGDSVATGTGADGNGNGAIDPGDLAVWSDNYGASSAPASATVPEPSAALAAGAALLGATARRRRV